MQDAVALMASHTRCVCRYCQKIVEAKDVTLALLAFPARRLARPYTSFALKLLALEVGKGSLNPPCSLSIPVPRIVVGLHSPRGRVGLRACRHVAKGLAKPRGLTSDPGQRYPEGMNRLKRITLEPGKRGGKPCIRGLRITVYDVLEYLASGMTEAEILADFPDLEREDIRAVLTFAAERERRLMSIPPG